MTSPPLLIRTFQLPPSPVRSASPPPASATPFPTPTRTLPTLTPLTLLPPPLVITTLLELGTSVTRTASKAPPSFAFIISTPSSRPSRSSCLRSRLGHLAGPWPDPSNLYLLRFASSHARFLRSFLSLVYSCYFSFVCFHRSNLSIVSRSAQSLPVFTILSHDLSIFYERSGEQQAGEEGADEPGEVRAKVIRIGGWAGLRKKAEHKAKGGS
jgi:hypothetical protein